MTLQGRLTRRSISIPESPADCGRSLYVLLVSDALVGNGLIGIGSSRALSHHFDHIRHEMKSTHNVEEYHVNRRISGTFFLHHDP